MDGFPFRIARTALQSVVRRSVLLLILAAALSIFGVVRERRLQEQVRHDIESIEASRIHVYLPLRNFGEFFPGRL